MNMKYYENWHKEIWLALPFMVVWTVLLFVIALK
ncbi:MAG: hypothetical protein DDT19_01682 [Syntrophomonadaceae bacterium]|nr:hypothetical protein [Bacillota bacterium]